MMEMNNFNDLPNEILAQIFGNLRRNKDLLRVQQVNSRWNSVIDATVGLPLWIGDGSEFWESSSSWKPLVEIGKRGISRCFFSDVTDDLANFTNPSEAKFKFPNLVIKMEFDGILSQPIYDNLMPPLNHLTTLVFHMSTLTYINVNLAYFAARHTLNKLYIVGEGFTRHHFPNYNLQLLFDNFAAICNSHFPRLKKFDSTMPMLLDKEVQISCLISIFVDKHCKTLEEVGFTWTRRWRVDTGTSNPRTQEEMVAMIAEAEQAELDLKKLMLKHPSKWDLKYVSFVAEDVTTCCPTSQAMREAMLAQTNLKKLHYICWDYIPVPVDVLQTNAATLTDIGLSVDDIEEPVNCTVFAQCTNLRRLWLQADGQAAFDNLAVQVHRLQNVTDLPASITCIKMRNMYIDCESVEWIAKRLRNLQFLFLVNIGRDHGMGMTVPCLLWLLKCSHKLKMLKVKGLNSLCFFATFGFENYELDPVCPICQAIHHKGKGNMSDKNANSSNESKNNAENEIAVNYNDKRFLEQYLSETNYCTLYVPLLRKSKGVWVHDKDNNGLDDEPDTA